MVQGRLAQPSGGTRRRHRRQASPLRRVRVHPPPRRVQGVEDMHRRPARWTTGPPLPPSPLDHAVQPRRRRRPPLPQPLHRRQRPRRPPGATEKYVFLLLFFWTDSVPYCFMHSLNY